MEWISLNPSAVEGNTSSSSTLYIFSLMTKAGFQLETMRRGISPAVEEYFYFHPGLNIQVHEVKAPDQESQFFVFYPNGSTAFADGPEGLLPLLPPQ